MWSQEVNLQSRDTFVNLTPSVWGLHISSADYEQIWEEALTQPDNEFLTTTFHTSPSFELSEWIAPPSNTYCIELRTHPHTHTKQPEMGVYSRFCVSNESEVNLRPCTICRYKKKGNIWHLASNDTKTAEDWLYSWLQEECRGVSQVSGCGCLFKNLFHRAAQSGSLRRCMHLLTFLCPNLWVVLLNNELHRSSFATLRLGYQPEVPGTVREGARPAADCRVFNSIVASKRQAGRDSHVPHIHYEEGYLQYDVLDCLFVYRIVVSSLNVSEGDTVSRHYDVKLPAHQEMVQLPVEKHTYNVLTLYLSFYLNAQQNFLHHWRRRRCNLTMQLKSTTDNSGQKLSCYWLLCAFHWRASWVTFKSRDL